MQIIAVPSNQLIPYANNARVIPQEAIDKVAASINAYGFKSPIIVDKDMVIIAGHTRLLAAQKLSMVEVPVIVADDLSPAQVKGLRLADNRVADETSFDKEMLANEINILDSMGDLFGDLPIGFDPGEIAQILDPMEFTDDEPSDTAPTFHVVIMCRDDAEQKMVYSDMIQKGYNVEDI